MRTAGDREAEAEALDLCGQAAHDLGHLTDAHAYWAEALTILDALNHPDAPAIRARLLRVEKINNSRATPPELARSRHSGEPTASEVIAGSRQQPDGLEVGLVARAIEHDQRRRSQSR